VVERFFPLCVVAYLFPLWFYRPLAPQNRPQGCDSAHFENHWSKISYDRRAGEDNNNMFTNKHIQQSRLYLCSRLHEEFPAWFCSRLLAMIQACTHHSAIIVKSQQWPTPSESIATSCVKETGFVCDTSYTDYFYSWCGITHVCSQSIQHLDCTFKSFNVNKAVVGQYLNRLSLHAGYINYILFKAVALNKPKHGEIRSSVWNTCSQ